jgi:hypothetical protein
MWWLARLSACSLRALVARALLGVFTTCEPTVVARTLPSSARRPPSVQVRAECADREATEQHLAMDSSCRRDANGRRETARIHCYLLNLWTGGVQVELHAVTRRSFAPRRANLSCAIERHKSGKTLWAAIRASELDKAALRHELGFAPALQLKSASNRRPVHTRR